MQRLDFKNKRIKAEKALEHELFINGLKIKNIMVEDTTNAYANGVNVSFVSDYYMDDKNIRKANFAFLYVFLVLMAVVVGSRMYAWCILNPEKLTNRRGNDQGSYYLYCITNFVFIIFKYIGIIFFFFHGE